MTSPVVIYEEKYWWGIIRMYCFPTQTVSGWKGDCGDSHLPLIKRLKREHTEICSKVCVGNNSDTQEGNCEHEEQQAVKDKHRVVKEELNAYWCVNLSWSVSVCPATQRKWQVPACRNGLDCEADKYIEAEHYTNWMLILCISAEIWNASHKIPLGFVLWPVSFCNIFPPKGERDTLFHTDMLFVCLFSVWAHTISIHRHRRVVFNQS